jgi:acyl dehydratase
MSPKIKSDFPVSRDERRYEDYLPGSTYEVGSIAVTEAEIVDFARRFDPQEMHTDPNAAARGAYGGLIASGWHTAALMMRLFAEGYLPDAASLGSPGLDELRWLRPVRPGDELRIRASILEARRSRSRPDRGLVTTMVEVLNHRQETVMRLTAVNLIKTREGAGS